MTIYGGGGGPSASFQAPPSQTYGTGAGASTSTIFNSSASTLGNIFNFLGAAGTLYGTYKSVQIQKQVAEEYTQASRLATKLNSDSRAEQQAINSQQAAQERRQQIREERVRRGKIIQSSQNTGVSGSSGEGGALSAVSTQFSSNVGQNLGMLQGTANISQNEQDAANVMGEANNNMRAGQASAGLWTGIAGLSQNIFAGTGGFSSLFSSNSQAPASVETRPK